MIDSSTAVDVFPLGEVSLSHDGCDVVVGRDESVTSIFGSYSEAIDYARNRATGIKVVTKYSDATFNAWRALPDVSQSDIGNIPAFHVLTFSLLPQTNAYPSTSWGSRAPIGSIGVGSGSSGAGFETELFGRLKELACDAAEEGVNLKQSSAHDFSSFVRQHALSVRPAVSVTDRGTLRAVWKNKRSEQVALHFLGGSSINYVFFHLDGEKMRREYGEANFDIAAALIADRALWRLLRHER